MKKQIFMRRKAEYLPYIRAIRKDLGIPASFKLKLRFESDKDMQGLGGQVVSYLHGMRQLVMRINAEMDHIRTLEVLLHEWKHVEQRISGRMRDHSYGFIIWEGQKTPLVLINSENEAQADKAYWDQPWEKEARMYEMRRYRIFPRDRYLGQTKDGVRFYKTGRL